MICKIGIIFFLALTFGLAVCATTVKAKTTSRAATEMVIKRFKEYGRAITTVPIECLAFETDPDSPQEEVSITLREKHDKQCGGDPSTSPRVTTFTVKGKKVFVEDPVSGDLTPFNAKLMNKH